MRNLETPVRKFAVYGAHSSLGSALLYELLTRQHEVLALLDDLNSIAARPGLRAKLAEPCSAEHVGESVAGCDAVLYLFPRRDGEATELYEVLDGLLTGLPPVHVQRLILIGDFAGFDGDPETAAALQRLALHPLHWTLVDTPDSGFDLSLDDFLDDLDGRRMSLLRLASGIVDELESPEHIHERVRFHTESDR
ncbi:NAD(P)H-binding protein [Stutzerimonas tarimensis]|uniref:NAD(P)H-binding protein n=1 Tax=Stutzerimonas tarimensis TaxID=1507735 RepID=A0ABV7T540_9GAMM